jgi:hypothetical protein
LGQSQFSRSFAKSFDIHQAVASAARSASGRRAALADVLNILRQSDPEIALSAELEKAIMQTAAATGILISTAESRATAA